MLYDTTSQNIINICNYLHLITQNQMVPYKSIINGGLQSGKAIIIQGIIDHDVKRFVNGILVSYFL